MKKAWFLSVLLGCSAMVQAAEMKLLRYDILADRLPEGMEMFSPNNPSGLIRTADGEYITVVRTGADHVSDSNFIYGSRDEGKNWYPVREIKSDDPLCATIWSLYRLPSGKAIFAETVIKHTRRPVSYADMIKNKLRDYMTVNLYTSEDGGRTMTFLQEVVPPGTLGNFSVSGELVELANGDILMPAYCANPKKGGLAVGSGFLRSTDGGRTWGKFEKAFFQAPGDKPVAFNESAFTVNDDGTLFAWARTDTANQYIEPIYKAVSYDHGKTWSLAEKTDILGIFPVTVKLQNGLWVLMAGIRNDRFRDRVINFFTSTDGETWEHCGRAYHSKPEDLDGASEYKWGQTGGCQGMMEISPNQVMVVFSAGDLHMQGRNTYCDVNVLEFTR